MSKRWLGFWRSKKNQETSLGDIRDSLATLDEGVVITDSEGIVEWSNQAADYLLGTRLLDYEQCRIFEVISDRGFVDYFQRGRYKTPLEMLSPRSKSINLQLHLSLLDSGGRLIFVRDVSRTHRLESLRTDFVANVSHELKTPLTVIKGYIETFSDLDDGCDPHWSKALGHMKSQSHRMDSLISELMLLSRLETVPESDDHELLDMAALCQEIADEALLACNGERRISVHCDNYMKLTASRKEVRSAITNLVINAVKYTEKDDAISVFWYCDEDFAYIDVHDTGIGIEQKHIPRLTERFYRVDKSRSINTGGTGLGLAIVKHVLLRHQGEIQVRSTFGKGSTFTCVFPIARVSYR